MKPNRNSRKSWFSKLFSSLIWRRFLLNLSSINGPSSVESDGSLKLSVRLRYVFIIVAFIFLAIAAFVVLILAHNNDNGDIVKSPDNSRLLWRLKIMFNNHRTIVIFLSSTFALFQLLAIGAAIFNWSIVLFSYVIITGIFGTIIGVVGITGIIFTCLLMRHDDLKANHTLTITLAIVIAFVFIFYLMAVLGIRLMDYFYRRRNNSLKSIYNLRDKYRTSAMYRSIDSFSSPISRLNHEPKNSENDDDEEQGQTRYLSLLSSLRSSSSFDYYQV